MNDNELRKHLSSLFEDFEAKPQDDSWEVVRHAVISEDDNLRLDLINSFEDYEAEPQDNSWVQIRRGITDENKLLEEDLTNQLIDYVANPQKASWQVIKTALEDDSALKSSWTNLFADFEAEPQTESWEIIEAAIKKDKRRRFFIIPLFARVGIAASILLLLGLFLWNNSQKADNEGVVVVDSRDSNSKKSDIQKEINSKNKIDPSNQNSISKIKNNSFDNSIKNPSSKNRNSKELKINLNLIDSQIDLYSSTENNSNTISENNVKTTNSLIINELNKKEATELAINKTLADIPNTEKEEIEILEPPRAKRDWIITSNLMPLSTYQVFTILPQTQTYISQVSQLSALDNQRFGIQARIGAMKPLTKKLNLGASLSYTGMQQWASYSYTNGQYNVLIDNNDQITVTALTENVDEGSFLHALGLKVEESYEVKYKRSKFYLIAGGEAVRKLNKNQFGYYLNASVAFNYPINPKNSLWVEPTFRYGLTPSFDNNNYLKIQPYNIGLNFRMNFGK